MRVLLKYHHTLRRKQTWWEQSLSAKPIKPCRARRLQRQQGFSSIRSTNTSFWTPPTPTNISFWRLQPPPALISSLKYILNVFILSMCWYRQSSAASPRRSSRATSDTRRVAAYDIESKNLRKLPLKVFQASAPTCSSSKTADRFLTTPSFRRFYQSLSPAVRPL